MKFKNLLNAIYYIIEKIIKLLHIIIIILIITIPIFSQQNFLLTCYVLLIPFIVFHWVMNNDTCSLTVAELYFKGNYNNIIEIFEELNAKTKNVQDLFSYKFISPIYNFNNNYQNFSSFTYLLIFVLWGICAFKLWKKYKNKEIVNILDLFK
jgi:hypothetical protein